eukprot:760784-Hanusia_phi.AAC.1
MRKRPSLRDFKSSWHCGPRRAYYSHHGSISVKALVAKTPGTVRPTASAQVWREARSPGRRRARPRVRLQPRRGATGVPSEGTTPASGDRPRSDLIGRRAPSRGRTVLGVPPGGSGLPGTTTVFNLGSVRQLGNRRSRYPIGVGLGTGVRCRPGARAPRNRELPGRSITVLRRSDHEPPAPP